MSSDIKQSSDLREELRATRLKARLLEAKHRITELESCYLYPPAITNWGRIVPPREAVEPDTCNWTVDPESRRRGAHQAFKDERELAEIWYVSRTLADGNWSIVGMMKAFTNYTIGTGFTYRLAPKQEQGAEFSDAEKAEMAKAQAFLDADNKRVGWWETEREIFNRSRREDVFRRYFARSDGTLDVRFIEPEHVVNPPQGVVEKETRGTWSFGILCDKGDAQKVIAYWVSYTGKADDGEEIAAEEIDHYKINVDSCVRRSLSDFYCVAEVADELKKLHRNMRRGGAMLSSIPWIEQFTSATKDQVESFVRQKAQMSVPDPVTGQIRNFEQYRPGTVPRIPKGKEYLPPPLAQNTANFVEIARLARQALASRWNAPESTTGDASNGSYASLAVAESPWVKSIEVEQKFYGGRFEREKRRVLEHAADSKAINGEVLARCDLVAEPPPVIVRNRLDEANENQIELDKGVLSPQEWAAKKGRKLDQVQKEIAAAKAMGWTPQAPATPAAGLGPTLGGMMGESRQARRTVEAVLQEFGIWI